jgi:hypothetical protein
LRVQVDLFAVLCDVESGAFLLGISPQGHHRANQFQQNEGENAAIDNRGQDGDSLDP